MKFTNPLGWFNEPMEEPGTSMEDLKAIYPNAKLADLKLLQKQLEEQAKNPGKFVQAEPEDGLPEIQVLATAFDNQKPKVYDGKKLNKSKDALFQPGDLREVASRPVAIPSSLDAKYIARLMTNDGKNYRQGVLFGGSDFLLVLTNAANYSIEHSKDVGVFNVHDDDKLVALLNGSVH